MYKTWDTVDEQATKEGTAKSKLNSMVIKPPKRSLCLKAVHNKHKKRLIEIRG
jgi:hypothetical protein